jgi:predicted phosphodiesterase
MLVLIVGDTHFSGKNPIARIDDIVDVQFDKLDEIINLSNKYDAPIIHTGDVFNTSVIANSILTKIGLILTKLKHPLYFVWGNHDLLYHSLELWDRTSLGVLWKHNNKVKHISELGGWAWLDWDSTYGIQWMGEPKQKLLLTHKAVVTERKMSKGSWVLKDKNFCIDIENHDLMINLPKYYKLIICGHWHKPYIFHHKGTKVINPGPILRRTVEEWLMPSVVLLNTDTLIHKRIYLKAKPPEQVLSKAHIEQKVESYTEGVIKFIEQLQKTETVNKGTFLENLFELLDGDELPKNVEKILRNKIAVLIQKGIIKA